MAPIWASYGCVEELSIATASDFIDHLRRANNYWGSGGTGQWYFRGQLDANWALLPRAWRGLPPSGLEELTNSFYRLLQTSSVSGRLDHFARMHNVKVGDRAPFESFLAHLAAEQDAVRHFAVLADELGLPVPEATGLVSGVQFIENALSTKNWPEINPSAPFGVAQHHGIPTRLLDWTRSPLVAAFFASASTANTVPAEIAVWAINISFIRSTDPSFGLKILTSQRAQDPFLQKQEGLFIWHQGANSYFWANRRWPSLIDSVEGAFDGIAPKPLRVLKLPGTEVENLRALLWSERISLAHLMPTYDNVARTAIATWATYSGLRTEVSAYGD